MSSISPIADLLPDTYGKATAAVVRVLRLANGFLWFPSVPSDGDAGAIEETVQLLVRMSTASDHVRLVRGDLMEAARLYRAANPPRVPDDQAYARGKWRDDVGRLFGAVAERAAADETVRARFVAPLFPVEGKASVSATSLVAAREVLKRRVPTSVDQEAIWLLMCDVEDDFWSAITCEIVGAPHEREWFARLLHVYARGYYPIGFIGNEFAVFTHR